MGMQDKIDFIIEEMIEEHLRDQRNESEEYREVMNRLIELADQIQKYKRTMDEEVQRTLVDYSDTRNEMENMQYQYWYLAGLKDTVHLLKVMELL